MFGQSWCASATMSRSIPLALFCFETFPFYCYFLFCFLFCFIALWLFLFFLKGVTDDLNGHFSCFFFSGEGGGGWPRLEALETNRLRERQRLNHHWIAGRCVASRRWNGMVSKERCWSYSRRARCPSRPKVTSQLQPNQQKTAAEELRLAQPELVFSYRPFWCTRLGAMQPRWLRGAGEVWNRAPPSGVCCAAKHRRWRTRLYTRWLRRRAFQ